MGVWEKQGLCLAVTGYEENYIEFHDGAPGAATIVHAAAGTNPDHHAFALRYAFEAAATIELGGRKRTLKEVAGEDDLLADVEEYRRRTGRRWPPIYRVRLVVSATDLGDAEAERWWRALVERNARAAAAP